MAFSFNWSGLQVPQMLRRDTSAQAIQSAGEFGRAARGYEKREADKEYMDILGESVEDTQAIEAEIARIENRNAEIRKQLGIV